MKHLIYLSIVFFLYSCESKTKLQKPEDLISKEQMIDLLVDLHIGVAAQNIKNKNLERNINYLTIIFEKYGVDSTRFEKSNTYYLSNIEEYENMFEEVQKQIEVLREKYDLEKDTLSERMEEYENRAEKIKKGELVK